MNAMLTVRSRAYVLPTLLLIGLAYALANGLGYNCGNLRQYMLHGLNGIDAEFLANDWFTTQTRAHHTAFNAAIVLAGGLARLDVTFAAANAACALSFVGCIYLLARRFYPSPIVVTAVAVFIVIFAPKSMIGWSSIMGPYFQPQTVGAVGLLAGLTCLIHERYKTAGLIFFTASLFHINYMVWITCIVGVVIFVNLGRIGMRRALYVIVPIALAVVYHLPFVIEARSPDQLAHSTAAARILHDIYMPFHSRPLTWGLEPFVRFAAMLAAGAIALKAVGLQRTHTRMTVSILGVLAAIISVGMVLTIIVQVDAVALIHPYRLAPFLILTSQIAVAGALVTTARSSDLSLFDTLVLWVVFAVLLAWGGVTPYGLLCLYVVLMPLLAARLARQRELPATKMLLTLGGLVAVLYGCGAGRGGLMFVGLFIAGAVCWRLAQRSRFRHRGWLGAMLCGRFAVPLVIAVFMLRLGSVRKDFMGPPPPADEQQLYDWCRTHTDPNDRFIIPPSLAGFRIGAERAVVIDWKCMPIQPQDTVEWYGRLVDVCGMEIDTEALAETGYAGLDVSRARSLSRKYQTRFLVCYSEQHKGDLAGLPQVYHSPTFALYDLGKRPEE